MIEVYSAYEVELIGQLHSALYPVHALDVVVCPRCIAPLCLWCSSCTKPIAFYESEDCE